MLNKSDVDSNKLYPDPNKLYPDPNPQNVMNMDLDPPNHQIDFKPSFKNLEKKYF